ncbi:MAG: GNAT family N-acetyltransferase [Desulfococcaceae bacterium]|jgi:GNAT superfamily N-acetyltransferase|nr:GNAT family N-acetyltransferase [Desulfococcaceae bacterium]
MLKIEVLRRDHDRAGFDCGNEALNQYIRNIARQHLSKGISRTFVIIDENFQNVILGFYTLTACEIHAEKLPRKYAKKYPPKIPAAKLARISVSKDHQRQGLGALMMIDAIKRVMSVSEHLGITGFFVDAKDSEAKAWYHQYGFMELPDNPLELFLPLPTLKTVLEILTDSSDL